MKLSMNLQKRKYWWRKRNLQKENQSLVINSSSHYSHNIRSSLEQNIKPNNNSKHNADNLHGYDNIIDFESIHTNEEFETDNQSSNSKNPKILMVCCWESNTHFFKQTGDHKYN